MRAQIPSLLYSQAAQPSPTLQEKQPEQEVLVSGSSVDDIDVPLQLSEVDIGEQLWAALPIHSKETPQSFFTVNMMEVTTAPFEWKEDQFDKLVQLTNLSWTPATIWGRVQVCNMCYEKYIAVHLTTDNWSTYEEYPATYEASSSDQTRDSFIFKMQLTESTQCVEFAVRYCYDGQEAWDNNADQNYALKFN